MATVSLLLYAFTSRISAHSWVRCSDYHAEITGRDYDESQCTGWIRGWEFNSVTFGQDRGVNYQVGLGGGQPLCQRALSGTKDNNYGYANADKIAQYTSGETVRVMWPAKNHANYECGGNIPDTSMKLYMNPNVDPTADLPNNAGTMTAQGYTLVKDWHDGCTPQSDGCGFQNCPKYCEDTGGATCFGDFVVPDVTDEGYYTFVWYWIFNPGSPYTSCYEAYVKPAAANSNTESEFSKSAGSSATVTGYITQAPICLQYTDNYDTDSLDDWVKNKLMAAMSDSDKLNIIDKVSGSNAMNFTIQIEHGISTGKAINTVLWDGTKDGSERDDTMCDDFENEYSGTQCANCKDVKTFALESGANALNVRFGTYVAMIVALFVAFA